ncbi:1835_t:CDS:2, partial [Diversispora eburnea]
MNNELPVLENLFKRCPDIYKEEICISRRAEGKLMSKMFEIVDKVDSIKINTIEVEDGSGLRHTVLEQRV